MPKRISQNALVLQRLKQPNGYITSWAAIELFRITRLAARIADLKEDGWNIKSNMSYKNNGTRFAVYTLGRPHFMG